MYTITLYKSKRKNSKNYIFLKSDLDSLVYKAKKEFFSDDEILKEMTEILEEIIAVSKDIYNNKLIIKIDYEIMKVNSYINANGDTFKYQKRYKFTEHKKEYSSIEEVINLLIKIIACKYNYNKLDEKEIFKDSNIKYLINKYYN